MSTERQIEANRANAQRSTGPRTDAGKSASSQNAATHSLTAKGFIILPGQAEAFAQLQSDLRSTLLPTGPLQEIIFTRAFECAWTLHRCRIASAELYQWAAKTNPSIDPIVDNQNEARYSRVQKYAREAENSMYKAMRELGKLQAEQKFRQEAFPLTLAQSENEQLFAQTPHALSEVCNFTLVMTSVAKTNTLPKAPRQIEAISNPAPLIARAAA